MKHSALPFVLSALLALPQLSAAQKPSTEVKNAPPTALTAEKRAAIEAQVRSVVEAISAAAREANADRMLAHMSTEDALCLFGESGATSAPCSQVWAAFRNAWSPQNRAREARQEFDGEQIQVSVLTPDVASASWTMRENRGYGAGGKLQFRGKVAGLLIFVRENGTWRLRSAEQAVWPLSGPARPAGSCEVEGVWDLVSSAADGVPAPAGLQSRKFITDGKFAWVQHEPTPVKDLASAADTLAAFRTRQGGTGSYAVSGSTYTEKIEAFPVPAYEGISVPFHCRVEGDRFFQSGKFPILQDGKVLREVLLEEVYRRSK